jgi:hypothetical protein
LAACEEGLGLRRALTRDPNNARAKRELAVTLLGIVDVKLRGRDQPGALSAAKECVRVYRDLAKDKINASAQRDFATGLMK